MKLNLIGHDDLYAVEQLQMSLFGSNAEGEAISRLSRSGTYCTASATITYNGRTATACRRFKTRDETVRLRRQKLQQSYYAAAIQLLPKLPPWGALSGVRPTKITTKHLLEGGTPKSADKLLRDTYYVTPERRELALDCSASTVKAADIAVKTAKVNVNELRLSRGMGGKGMVLITGDVGDVTAAVEAGAQHAKDQGLFCNSAVIPAPHKELWEQL